MQHYRENPPDETELPAEQNEDSAGAAAGQMEVGQTEGEETEGEQSDRDLNESTESIQTRQPLQTMSRPLGEAEEVSSSIKIDQLQSPQSNGDPSARAGEGASSSYYSAESNPDAESTTQSETDGGDLTPRQQPGNDSQPALNIPSIRNISQPNSAASASESESTRALLEPAPQQKLRNKPSTKSAPTLQQQEPDIEEVPDGEDETNGNGRSGHGFFSPFSHRVARYNIGDNFQDKRQRLRARVARTQDGVYAMRPLRRRFREGEIIKAERMLVMVQETAQKDLPDDYTEKDSLKVETRPVDKWREFLVVCRRVADEEAPFSIQMYKTRVIPENQNSGTRTKPYHEIHLDSKRTGESLYSSLDKTLVFWRPCKFGTQIYIARPKSAAHAVEWHTFILQILGGHRPTALPISVPDLGVSLIFKNPFEQLLNLASRDERLRANNAFSRAIAEEEYASTAIIRGCLGMLENRPEWTEVLREWSKTTRLGLAWKRYDRLEWVFGPNEKSMYGTIAMTASHELELRPRQHYPTAVKYDATKEDEPLPVEGFLVRLTSQRGVHQRMNKVFFKRLYFFTQDHYLFFCKPSKAIPPPPPKISLDESRVPSSREILNNMPLSYDIDPFPVEDGKITWLDSGNKTFVAGRDEAAFAQYQRNIYNLCQTDGYIDLCRVTEVRLVERGSSPADHNIRRGSDVEFNPESRNTQQDDGTTRQFDDEKTFEMLMDNGLVVRLQTYNDVTRDKWMKRLDTLVKYWKWRCAADTAELKAIRQRNLELLEIDEEMESIVGQLAQKWQVRKTEASPHLHNMCGLVGCRTIKVCCLLLVEYHVLMNSYLAISIESRVVTQPSRRAMSSLPRGSCSSFGVHCASETVLKSRTSTRNWRRPSTCRTVIFILDSSQMPMPCMRTKRSTATTPGSMPCPGYTSHPTCTQAAMKTRRSASSSGNHCKRTISEPGSWGNGAERSKKCDRSRSWVSTGVRWFSRREAELNGTAGC